MENAFRYYLIQSKLGPSIFDVHYACDDGVRPDYDHAIMLFISFFLTPKG